MNEPHEWLGVPPWAWPWIARQLPPPKMTPFLRSRRKGGRPRLDDRLALSAILWRLRTGGTWENLPARFGSAATARRRLALWTRGDRLERLWRAYLEQISRAERERWRDAFVSAAIRSQPDWRFGLTYVWRLEFLPLV